MRNTVADSKALDSLLEKVYRDSGQDFREYKRGRVECLGIKAGIYKKTGRTLSEVGNE